MPARLPIKFWKPVHRPAACGPARVWVMAQRLEELALQKITPAIIRKTQSAGPLTADRPSRSPESASPPATNVLRTRVGVAPAEIQRSEYQPAKVADAAPSR